MNNKSNPLISVIVPIYNVEMYLERCVSSIINQTYTKIEIILVNDGSTDKCPDICDSFAAKDERITVIHQPNKGLSAARNTGIEIFNGEWICFIDSDDWVAENFIELLLTTAVQNNTLMSACKIAYIFDSSQIIHVPNENNIYNVKLFNWREYLFHAFAKWYTYNTNSIGYCPYSACSKLYNKKVIRNFRFSPHRIAEDTSTTHLFVYACYKYDSAIAVNDACMYYYFQRPGSISKDRISAHRIELMLAFEEALNFFKKKKEIELYNLYWRDYFRYGIEIVFDGYLYQSYQDHELVSLINLLRMGKAKAYELAHQSLNLSLSAESIWNSIINFNGSYVMYGYGNNGKKLKDWLLYFNIPIVEIWDKAADSYHDIDGIPVRKMHGGFLQKEIRIICTIANIAMSNEVFYDLRILGYEMVVPFPAIDHAVKYAKFKQFLPFLLS